MPATSKILSYHGAAAGTSTDVTGVAFPYKLADNDTADLNNNVPIPSTGISYSYPKFTKLSFTTTPGSQIRDLKWYMDPRPELSNPATDWTGLTMWVGITATYSQPNANDANALRAGLTASADVYTASTPLNVFTGALLSNPSIGVGSQVYVVTQMAVLPTCVAGVKTQRQWYYRYLEV